MVLESGNQEANQTETFVEKVKKKSSDSHREKQLFQNIAQTIIEQIYDIVPDVAKEFGSDFRVIYKTARPRKVIAEINWNNLTFSQQIVGISYKYSNQSFFPEFEGYITGNEVVVISSPERPGAKPKFHIGIQPEIPKNKYKEVELLRVSLSGEPDFTRFAERLRKFYAEGVERIIPN
ncbi:MAG: hypothetical protein F6K39_06685 [Okeania sp. SIO3B3]|nr:hypothetical protein [Okeania sp. SIO3B3]